MRHALGAGFALSLGLTFMPLGCENWNRPMFTPVHRLEGAPDMQQIPKPVREGFEACLRMLPEAGPEEKEVDHLVAFGVQIHGDGQAGAVRLGRSTLGDRGVEACMAEALQGMRLSLEELQKLIGEGGGKHLVSIEVKGLLADDRQESFQVLPGALSAAGRIVLVVVVLWVLYEAAKDILAGAKATSAAVPRVAAPPKARKYPNQTCEDEELAKLEAEKDKLCNDGYAVNCKGNPEHPEDKKRLDTIPCSKIMLSLQQRLACFYHRNLIEDLCFGGVPDEAHKGEIENVKRGAGHCAKLKEINCAEGHPMSGI